MPTLIVSPRFSLDAHSLWQVATKERGWGFHRAIRLQVPDNVEDPILYGDSVFCDAMARKLGLMLLEPADDWLAKLPQKYLLRKVDFMRAWDLQDVKQRSFIKPACDKVFPAGIYEEGWHVPLKYIDKGCPCLVSEVVSFEQEVRCYVLDRQIVTAGTYLTNDAISDASAQGAHIGAQQWLNYLLADESIEIPSAVVIDVGFIEGVGWAVIEANSAYNSGIYMRGEGISADPKKLLPLLQRASSRIPNHADRKYVRLNWTP
jgi:hypothetical protein